MWLPKVELLYAPFVLRDSMTARRWDLKRLTTSWPPVKKGAQLVEHAYAHTANNLWTQPYPSFYLFFLWYRWFSQVEIHLLTTRSLAAAGGTPKAAWVAAERAVHSSGGLAYSRRSAPASLRLTRVRTQAGRGCESGHSLYRCWIDCLAQWFSNFFCHSPLWRGGGFSSATFPPSPQQNGNKLGQV